MNAALKRYADRIDALTLRERSLIFAAATAILVLLAKVALIDPLLSQQRRLGQEVAANQKAIGTTQLQIQQLAAGEQSDPHRALRERVASLRTALESLEADIAEEQRRFTDPERMRPILEEMLSARSGLALVEMKTLPVTILGPTAGAGKSSAGIFRHGVEVTVQGRYLDLHGYLTALESLPTRLYWGKATLTADYPVATLKVTIYTLSVERAWIVV